jgi:hypothetical protein
MIAGKVTRQDGDSQVPDCHRRAQRSALPGIDLIDFGECGMTRALAVDSPDADRHRPPVPPAVSCRRKHAVAGGRELRPAADHRFGWNSADSAQQGRVWFYREVDLYKNPTTPYVRLNGAIAGVPEQGGAFYRDVPLGHYQITVDSEGMSPSPSRDIAVAAGKQIYARIGLGGSWNGQGFTIALAACRTGV